MEFKLNKIDTDIRLKMQEEIKDDKVHAGKSISVKKDLKDEKHGQYEQIERDAQEENKKRYITIDGVRSNSRDISIKAEKLEEINYENSKGRIFDTKK